MTRLILTILALTACAPGAPRLELPASYAGRLPCADCPGVDMTLTLFPDSSYRIRRVYQDRDGMFTDSGRWRLEGKRLVLVDDDGGAQFSVEDDGLRPLDRAGEPIPSEQPVRLARTELDSIGDRLPTGASVSELEGRRWTLLALGDAPAIGATIPWMELDQAAGRASGHAGCNRFAGPYEAGEDSLRFGALVSTKMACMDDAANRQETGFLGALEQTRAWRISGDTLDLEGAGGVLARFTPGAGEQRAAGSGATGTGATGTANDTVVTLARTRSGQLPAAITGTAPAPQGAPVKYFADDPATTGYLALPQGPGPHPAVILVHEWDGLSDRIRQMADALAAEGYVAFAADMYSGQVGRDEADNRRLMQASLADTAKLIRNLDAAARYLRGRPDVRDEAIATMGWCYGGGVALAYGVGGEHHAGTAMFYGRLIMDPQLLARMRHPLYGTFAERDNITREQVAQFVSALREAGIENDVHVYDEVEHGFWLFVDEAPAVRRAPALDAWERLKRWLGRTLG